MGSSQYRTTVYDRNSDITTTTGGQQGQANPYLEKTPWGWPIDGVDLIGYMPWGCIDLVSAGTGEMKKRYGFVYVDLDDTGKGTFNRIKKDSFYWYKSVIASNGSEL